MLIQSYKSDIFQYIELILWDTKKIKSKCIWYLWKIPFRIFI